MTDEPDFGETCQQCGQPATYGPGICKMCYAFGDLEPERPVWRAIGAYNCLPKGNECTRVLAAYPRGRVQEVFVDFECWVPLYEHARATHWMPLPEPPEEA